jgi:hypothetical protein
MKPLIMEFSPFSCYLTSPLGPNIPPQHPVLTDPLPSNDKVIFTEPLPSNDRATFTEPLPSNDRGDTQTHTNRQQRDLISLLLFFQNKESRLKIQGNKNLFYLY